MPDPAPEAGGGEFYVGYLPVPQGLRRFLTRAAPLLACVVVAAGVLLARTQRDPGAGAWRDRETVTVRGTLVERPYPMLVGTDRAGPVFLVQTGKHGAAARAAGLDAARVEARGTLLLRDGGALLEIGPGDGDLRATGEPAGSAPAIAPVGKVTLAGEIVDSKCYHGAMKPGEGKPHKECATLCIRGGIPPMFAARGADGRVTLYLLAGAEGGPMDPALLDLIADPVEARGEVWRIGSEVAVLRVDAGGVSRR